MSDVFLVVAILSALWGVVDSILIMVALDKRGIPVNMFLARVYFFRYLNEYKRVTVKETGAVGQLYHSYITAMSVALVCAVIGLMLRAG